MKLSTLAVGLGLLLSMPHLYGLLKPAAFAQALRKFPRSEPWGYALMALGTLWFLGNLQAESISDFAAYKNLMLIGFGAVGLLTCLYVRDFLAVRGLAVVMLLLAKVILDTARWHPSEWRLVLAVVAYGWILAGMWFTISPWRLRDILNWVTANETRVRVASAVRLTLGLLILALGLFVF
ncbi:MAG: hypothetical protein L0Z50_22365 [Verrucomicrobiales bacterium]|nr:hypothetical protein [Verrucomicrobiales bacterium]